MTKFSPLAIAGIAVGSLFVFLAIIGGGSKVTSKKLGAETGTIYHVITNPIYDTTKLIQGSSSGGSRRRCKKGGKRKTKGRTKR